MDYESYKYEITNLSDESILLNNNETIDSMYLQDEKNVKYSAYINELPQSLLEIFSGESKILNIKYYSKYSSTRIISKIAFDRVIFNYETSPKSGQVQISL